MRIDDFIVYGRTVPDTSKKYGLQSCMAGYSPELRQLIRVYPLTVKRKVKCFDIARLELIRPSGDSRAESWRLNEDKIRPIQIIGNTDASKIHSHLEDSMVDSISEANNRKLSLAIIKPKNAMIKMELRETIGPDQCSLFDEAVSMQNEFIGGHNSPQIPYLHFEGQNSKYHRLQLRDWGCYESIRRFNSDSQHLDRNLKLNDKTKTKYLIVGNHFQHRNIWLVIKVIALDNLVANQMVLV